MKIALIGQGAMGQLVAARARNSAHEIGLVLTSRDAACTLQELATRLRGHDVAIDFSVAAAVLSHVTACVQAQVPLVEGTTGWKGQEDEVRQVVLSQGGGLIFGANFSIGVNLFYRVVTRAAELFCLFQEYDPFIEEAHHRRKRDAPSGTALRVRDLLQPHWPHEIPVTSTRAGYIPGTHRVGFDSAPDQVLLTHAARSREGFAAGALLAAQWITGRQGVFEFSEMLDEILEEKGRVKDDRKH